MPPGDVYNVSGGKGVILKQQTNSGRVCLSHAVVKDKLRDKSFTSLEYSSYSQTHFAFHIVVASPTGSQ